MVEKASSATSYKGREVNQLATSLKLEPS